MFQIFGFKKVMDFFSRDNTKSNSLKSLDLEGVAQLIIDGKVKNIITMAGAGISTSAGIPDFRSPSSGIYDNLRDYNLPSKMAVFSSSFFEENPKPFFALVQCLYKPEAKPTLAHYFISLLEKKGLLLRHYTQNVDNLERLSGLCEARLIESHGTFQTGHCLSCRHPFDFGYMRDRIMEKKVPSCSECGGVIKPDVVLFGDNLPRRFYNHVASDFAKCNLLIILGTSLSVYPFAALIHRVPSGVPRLYLNREYCPDEMTGIFGFFMRYMVAGIRKNPFRWNKADNKSDVFVACESDDGVMKLATLLGWQDELLSLKQSTDALLASSMEQDSLRKQLDTAT